MAIGRLARLLPLFPANPELKEPKEAREIELPRDVAVLDENEYCPYVSNDVVEGAMDLDFPEPSLETFRRPFCGARDA